MRSSGARAAIVILSFQLVSAAEQFGNVHRSRERLALVLARAEERIVELEQGLRECRGRLHLLSRDKDGGAELTGRGKPEQRRGRSQKDRRSSAFRATAIMPLTGPMVSRSPSPSLANLLSSSSAADHEVMFRPVGTSRRLLNDNDNKHAGFPLCWPAACAVACVNMRTNFTTAMLARTTYAHRLRASIIRPLRSIHHIDR